MKEWSHINVSFLTPISTSGYNTYVCDDNGEFGDMHLFFKGDITCIKKGTLIRMVPPWQNCSFL